MHVLIVDDDIRMARLIEAYMRGKSYRVSVATRGVEAVNLAAQERPDLVILDVGLPDMTGIEVCQKLRWQRRKTPLPILFLSGKGTVDDKIAGFEAGGDDYLSKPFDFRELEVRVEALMRRAQITGQEDEPSELSVGTLRLNTRTFKVVADDREVQLTPVEFELLHYLMARAGEVVSAEQLLQEVWRYYPGTGDTAVVRVQIMNLREKIEEDRRSPQFIQTVYRHGYMVAA